MGDQPLDKTIIGFVVKIEIDANTGHLMNHDDCAHTHIPFDPREDIVNCIHEKCEKTIRDALRQTSHKIHYSVSYCNMSINEIAELQSKNYPD